MGIYDAVTALTVKPVISRDELDKYIKELSPGIDKTGKRVLGEVRLNFFREIPSWIQFYEGDPVSIYSAYFQKRKPNVWSPYMSAYTVFTRADVRRKGFATNLANHVKREAVKAGCKRMKDLAGSYVGYCFHTSCHDQFWAWTDRNSLMIDTPLVDPSEFPQDATPIAARKWTHRTTPLTKEELAEIVRTHKFAYDI